MKLEEFPEYHDWLESIEEERRLERRRKNGAVQRYMPASKASIWPWVFLVAIVGVVISAACGSFSMNVAKVGVFFASVASIITVVQLIWRY